MNTQCPKCKTIFYVTEDIIAVKEGLVRCGDCENVFNATWNLLDNAEFGQKPVASENSAELTEQVITQQVETQTESTPAIDYQSPSPDPSASDSEDEIEDGNFSPNIDLEEEIIQSSNDALADDFFSLPEDDDDSVILGSVPNKSLEDIANSMSDEDIQRTLRLDEALDLDPVEEPTEPSPTPLEIPYQPEIERVPLSEPEIDQPLSSHPHRIEPQLNPGTRHSDLRVDREDRILTNYPPKSSLDLQAGRAAIGRKAKVLLRTPLSTNTVSATHKQETEPQTVPVHWDNMADQPSSGSQMLWATAMLLALVLLLGQIRFSLVNELFAIPSTRPFISLFCEFAGCEPPARTDTSQINIARTRVDLHSNVPGALTIKVNLINKAAFAQPYPPLQLTLTDKEGRIVGRRTYLTSDYAPGKENSLMLDPGILSIATLNLAHPNESAVGFETILVGQ
ncbi:MAG: putative Zn finger-like uncharacterized protein [Parasphingorhabdus sp.]|jgi:predicted Zn finger-like uncharacterized protein